MSPSFKGKYITFLHKSSNILFSNINYTCDIIDKINLKYYLFNYSYMSTYDNLIKLIIYNVDKIILHICVKNIKCNCFMQILHQNRARSISLALNIIISYFLRSRIKLFRHCSHKSNTYINAKMSIENIFENENNYLKFNLN